MRYSLFLATCFFLVNLLPFIPYRTIEGGEVLIHSKGMLPSLLNFSIICVLLLLTTAVLTHFMFKKNLRGRFILKRTDLNLGQELSVVAFWIAFIPISQILSDNYFYLITGLAPYFTIILVIFSAYILFKKWYIQKTEPDFLSIDGENIYLKSLFGIGKREMKNLIGLSYNSKRNSLTLQFKEGLESIKIHLADYKFAELKYLLEVLKNAKSDKIQMDESLNIFFGSLSKV